MTLNDKILVKNWHNIPPEKGHCGLRRRIVTQQDNINIGISHLHIQNAKAHYHKKAIEIYICVGGKGQIKVNNDLIELENGSVIVIPPGSVHQPITKDDFEVLIIMQPPLAETDDIYYIDSTK